MWVSLIQDCWFLTCPQEWELDPKTPWPKPSWKSLNLESLNIYVRSLLDGFLMVHELCTEITYRKHTLLKPLYSRAKGVPQRVKTNQTHLRGLSPGSSPGDECLQHIAKCSGTWASAIALCHYDKVPNVERLSVLTVAEILVSGNLARLFLGLY